MFGLHCILFPTQMIIEAMPKCAERMMMKKMMLVFSEAD